jgi:uncharacterized protein YbjQ (UPF0145 family)
MTHPTVDELEAMAKRLDSVSLHLPLSRRHMRDAAALLRACKGGDARTYEDGLEDAAKVLEAMPAREERLGGQRFKYVQLGEATAAIRAMKGKTND